SGSAAVAYFWANERATMPTLASGSGSYVHGKQHGAPTARAAVAYFRANERATLEQSAGPAAIQFFRANERSTIPPVPAGSGSYVHGKQHGVPIADATPVTIDTTARLDGFDWSAAAIGAATALIVALLAGASLVVLRRSSHARSREIVGLVIVALALSA